jgi:hypothetical protein
VGENDKNNPTVTKRRIEACVMQAQMNAANHGGDNATASADLMCAFVLISVKSGAPPDKALAAMWDHAVAAVADFWPEARIN